MSSSCATSSSQKTPESSAAVMGSRVPGLRRGGRLVFHVGTQVIPCLRNLGFIQIDFVRDFSFDITYVSFLFLCGAEINSRPAVKQNCRDRRKILLRCHPCLVKNHPLCAYIHMLTLCHGASPSVSHTRETLSARPQKPIRKYLNCRNPTACGSLRGSV